MNYPYILHHGANAGVTGPCHQLQIDAQHSLLVDIEALVRVCEGASRYRSQPAGRRQQSSSAVHRHCGWWHVCEYVVDYLKFIQHDSRPGVFLWVTKLKAHPRISFKSMVWAVAMCY